ncbi:MAG TPA: hypothetical protein VGK59_01645 [Ohtaekwangia sp.]
MKFWNTYLILTFLLLSSAVVLKAQEKGKYYSAIINVDGILVPYSVSSSCGSSYFNAQKNTIVKYINDVGDNVFVEVFRKFGNHADQVQLGQLYCMSKSAFNTYFIRYSRIDYGILAIPYKMRFEPFSIYPGGTLGGYVGRKKQKLNGTTTLAFFGGFSSIPLNSANSETIDNKFGFSTGLAYIWNIEDSGFQLGLISGIDLFDGVEDWVYGYQPWLSFSIGFGFTSPRKSDITNQLQGLNR